MSLAIPYVINIPNAATAASLQSQYPNGITIQPTQAQVQYNYTAAYGIPNVWILWLGFNFSLYRDVESFVAGGADCYWVGSFLYAPSSATPPPPTWTRSPYQGTRRWVDGFELPNNGEGAGSSRFSRDASRTPEGYGFCYRANNNAGKLHPLPTPAAVSWERFYIRVRALPSGGEDYIWSMKGSLEGTVAAILTIDVNGALKAYNLGNQGTGYSTAFFIGSPVTLALNVWYRIELGVYFSGWDGSGKNGNGWLYVGVNGTISGPYSQSFPPLGPWYGLGLVQNHVNSTLGSSFTASNGLEADFDDWINAAEVFGSPSGFLPGVPALFQDASTNVHFPGFDVFLGSHVKAVRPTGFGPGQSAGWTGDWRELDILPPYGSPTAAGLSTSAASAAIDVTTDYVDPPSGCASFVVGIKNISGLTTTKQLGWAIAGGATQLNTVTMVNANWVSTVYSMPGGTITPPAISGLDLLFQRDANVFAESYSTLMAAAEQLGVFGACDVPPNSTATYPVFPGIHNAPYTAIGASASRSAPQTLPYPGIVMVNSGVYVGNNFGQDVLMQIAAEWVFVRPLTSPSDGTFWYSSMVAAHGWTNSLEVAARLPRPIGPSTAGGTDIKFRVASGSDALSNQSSRSYQWIAVSDPGSRFMLNGAFAHALTLPSAVNPLFDSAFTPDYVFAMVEQQVSLSPAHFVRGPGHTGSQASPLGSAVAANIMTPAQGQITSLATLHTDNQQTAYSAWRKTDNGLVSGAFDLTSYVGDGNASKTITVALNGKVPLFAIITPHNAISIYRDPSHTTNNSSDFSGAGYTTGITGGAANAITVGLTLNALGVVYEVFVIAGGPPGAPPVPPWTPNPPPPYPPFIPVPPGPSPPGPFPSPPLPPGPLPAGCISFGTAVSELAGRLGDATGVHWTGAELQRYLFEALRTYNAFTLSARNRASFTTQNGVPFYDLAAAATGLTPAFRAYTLKDQDLLLDLQYTLQESASANSWTGTSMFTLSEVTQAMVRRRDRFLRETGVILARETSSVTPDANGRVSFPSDVITIRRAAWTAGGVTTVLNRDNEWAASAFNRAWPSSAAPQVPIVYSLAVTPSLTVQLAPPPNAIGTLDTLSVVLGATLDPTTGVLLGIPDDFAWVVKWGVLADLFSASGPAADPVRAAHALQRWNHGIEAAKRAAVVLAAQIAGAVVPVNAVQEADYFNASWQNGADVPTNVLLAGLNIVALSPVPNGAYTVTLDLVRNMPIPTALSDCYYSGGVATTSALLDYAEYLALFKEGPSQARAAAEDLLTSFLDHCGVALALDFAQDTNRAPIMGQTKRDETIVPRLRSLSSGEGGGQ